VTPRHPSPTRTLLRPLATIVPALVLAACRSGFAAGDPQGGDTDPRTACEAATKLAADVDDPIESRDSIVKSSGDRFTDLAKRTYRVIPTRRSQRLLLAFLNASPRDAVHLAIEERHLVTH
jgi:hypothetical protein